MSGKRPPRMLSAEDKLFIKLLRDGMNRSKAYRISHPAHPSVQRYVDLVKTQAPPEQKRAASQTVTQLSKNLSETERIQRGITTYNESMDKLAVDAIKTVDEIMNDTGASKKVRADLAMEMIRHKVGTPVQKVAVQKDENIIITFGNNHPDDPVDDIIDIDSIPEADVH